MSDENEPSGASTGSVVGEPVAWAVLDSRGMVCVAYICREAAEAYCEGTFNRMAPLYRQPTLTDAERGAIDEAAEWYGGVENDQRADYVAATLRGLLERLGGGR